MSYKTIYAPDPEAIKKKEDRLKSELENIILLFLAGKLLREIAHTQGIALIDEVRREIISMVNKQVSETGLKQISESDISETITKIEQNFNSLLDTSEEGITESEILLRSSLLATFTIYAILNHSTLEIGKKNDYNLIEWVNMGDSAVCETCISLSRIYDLNIETIPAAPHPSCRCILVILSEEKTSDSANVRYTRDIPEFSEKQITRRFYKDSFTVDEDMAKREQAKLNGQLLALSYLYQNGRYNKLETYKTVFEVMKGSRDRVIVKINKAAVLSGLEVVVDKSNEFLTKISKDLKWYLDALGKGKFPEEKIKHSCELMANWVTNKCANDIILDLAKANNFKWLKVINSGEKVTCNRYSECSERHHHLDEKPFPILPHSWRCSCRWVIEGDQHFGN